MKQRIIKFWEIIVMVAIIGFSMTGCNTIADVNRVTWSDYTFVPGKDYVVIGGLALKEVNQNTYLVDLMEMAIAMGGHDIINVRTTRTTVPTPRILNATAVAIKYTEETIKNVTEVRDGNNIVTTIISYPSGTTASADADSSEPSSKKKWYNPFTWFRG